MQHIAALEKTSLWRIKIFLLEMFCFNMDESPVSLREICKIRDISNLIASSSHFLFSVADLKHAIQTKYKIAIQHQVLVVNGGECMAPDRRVCSYSAGTVSACCVLSLNFHL